MPSDFRMLKELTAFRANCDGTATNAQQGDEHHRIVENAKNTVTLFLAS